MKILVPLFCMLATCITSVNAAVIVTNSSASTFTVSNTDLLQTALSSTTTANDWNITRSSPVFMNSATVTAFLSSGQAQGEPTLRNGIWENYTSPAINGTTGYGSAGTGNGYVVTYGLNLTTSPLGYKIDQIDLYSNWSGPGRDNILVTIAYSLVDSPTTFNDIVTNQAYTATTSNNGKMSIALTGIDAPLNVAAIRFTFPSTQENDGVGYSELDVFGTAVPAVAAVPEPASLTLFGVVGLMLLGWGLQRKR